MNPNTATRRAFLAATAGFAWTAQSWARVPGAIDRIRIALIGGAATTRTALDRFNAATLNGTGATLVETTSIGQPGVPRWQDLIARRDIDAVINAAPLLYRGAVTLAAVVAGKDVYVMPPIAPLVSEAEAIRDAAGRNGVLVQTGAERIGEPAWRDAKARVTAGTLGAIDRASVRFHHHPGGHILESLSDALTPLLHATPGKPERVAAVGGRNDGDTCKPPEMLMLTAYYANGRTLTATSTLLRHYHAAIRGDHDRIQLRSAAQPAGNNLLREWLHAIPTRQAPTHEFALAIQAITLANAAIEAHHQSKPITVT